MLAKSIPNLFHRISINSIVPWARKAMSVLVLIAGLAMLALIAQNQDARLFSGSPARILSMDAITPAVIGAGADNTLSGSVRPEDGRYRAIAEFLAKKYKVSQDVTFDLVSIAHAAGHQIGLDPLLIIAVMAVESRFNPIAESLSGAKGLMQVIPKYHIAKFEEFGGEKTVFDPQTNILVGSQILKEYLARTGNLSIALQMYAGALNDDHDMYTTKIMNEKQRLQQVVSRLQRNASTKTASARSVMFQASPLGQ